MTIYPQYRAATPGFCLLFAACLALAVPAHAQISTTAPLPPPPPGPAAPMPHSARHIVGPPGVAAVVNGQTIRNTTVSALAFQFAGADILDRMINDLLVDQEAKRLGITASNAEVAARYAQVRVELMAQQRAQNLPVQSIEALLAQNHQTLVTFKDSLRLRILAEKLVAKQLPPLHMVHARHILVVTNSSINPALKAHSDDDARKIIARAQDDLKKGMSWDDVARKYSEDPSNKDRGGDLGVISTGMAQIDPTFLAAALALQPGEITPVPIKSVYGYHLIKVDSTNAHPASPAEKGAYAAALLTARAAQFQQVIPPYLQSLRQKAKIVNYLAQ